MRVDERNTVPHQPKSISEIAAIRMTWKAALLTIQEIIAVGEM